jgi:hypothetical protein
MKKALPKTEFLAVEMLISLKITRTKTIPAILIFDEVFYYFCIALKRSLY